MNYIDFCDAVRYELEDYFGDRAKITLTPMQKNNGVVLDAIVIHGNESRVSPTLYMEPYYKCYKEGSSFESVLRSMIDTYENNSNKKIDIEFFVDYEKVKDGIIYKLVHKDLNEELLKEIPHKLWNDLVIIYCYYFTDPYIGNGTILIRNEHLKMWNVDEEAIYKIANINTPKLLPDEMISIRDTIKSICDYEYINVDDCDLFDEEDSSPAECMYVLSNKNKCFGAATLLYSNHIREISDRFGCGVYILPSSVHEVILLPQDCCNDEAYMRQMIKDVNEAELCLEEKLSDNLYYYDPAVDSVRVAFG